MLWYVTEEFHITSSPVIVREAPEIFVLNKENSFFIFLLSLATYLINSQNQTKEFLWFGSGKNKSISWAFAGGSTPATDWWRDPGVARREEREATILAIGCPLHHPTY